MVLTIILGLLLAFLAIKFFSISGKPSLYCHPSNPLKPLLSSLPILKQWFIPTFWLPTGNLQCLATAFRKVSRISYDRELFELSDGGVLALDHWSITENEKAPILILLHGLTGNTREPYMRATANLFAQNGWHTIGYNCRGSGGVRLRSMKSYSAAYTDDFKEVSVYLKKKYSECELYGIGFSLGSLILGKALSEWGDSSPFKGACLVSNPMELELAHEKLRASFLSRKVYRKNLNNRLRNLISKNRQFFSNVLIPENEFEYDLKHWDMNDYERFVICPTFGYKDEFDYYRDANTISRLNNIRTPTLVIVSQDDPFLGVIAKQEVEQSPYVALVVTKSGGHIAFFDKVKGPYARDDASWAERVSLHFFSLLTTQPIALLNSSLTEARCNSPKISEEEKPMSFGMESPAARQRELAQHEF